MAKRIKQRVTLGGKAFWVTGETQQDLFDAYLQHAIDEGIVVLPGSIPNTPQPSKELLFETRAWKWYNLYKVGKVRAKTLANYEGYLKKHLLPYFGQCDISTITIDDVQEFMNSTLHLQKRKDPVQIISGQDPFTRQVDVADLICKCGRAEVDGAGVHILRQRAGQLSTVSDVRFNRHEMSSFLG